MTDIQKMIEEERNCILSKFKYLYKTKDLKYKSKL
jgi:hypothetical protein